MDADIGQLRLVEAQFGTRFRVMLSSSAEGLLEQAEAVAPVAAPLADQRAGRGLLDSATTVLPDPERLLVAGTTELSQARAAVERGAAKRSFVKPWRPGEVAAALEDAVRISAGWGARSGRAWRPPGSGDRFAASSSPGWAEP